MNIKEIIINQSHPTNESWDDVVTYGKNVAQTADDAVRAGTNALTFGYADKLAGMGTAAVKGTDTDTEIKKQYGKSAEAEKRSPTASEVGRIASYAVPVGSAALGAKLAVKGASKILPKTLNTATKTGKAISIGSKGGAGIGGAVAGDVAAKEIATQFDPNNPHLEEGLGSKILGLLQKDVRGSAASGSKASKLSTASGQPATLAPGSLKPPTMTVGQGPTSPISTKPATTPKTSPTDAERIANLEKRVDKVDPSIGRKVANWAAKTAGQTAAVGGVGYGAYQGAKKYAFSPADASPHTEKYDTSDYAKKWDAAYKEKEKQDAEEYAKSQEPAKDISTPQSTDTNNGSTFSRDTFKESSTELERVKYLTKYKS